MDVKAVVRAILAGKFDGSILELNQAILARVRNSSVQTRWVITVDGMTIDEDEMTVGEMKVAEKLAGMDWRFLNPVRSADQFAAVVAAALHCRTDMALDEAVAKVDAMTTVAVNGAISEREVADGPKDSPVDEQH